MGDDLIGRLTKLAIGNNPVNVGAMEEHDIKRGLRNPIDGTGVKVILTGISNVEGRNEDKQPIDGRLIYRGIDIKDLAGGFLDANRYGFEETAFLLMFGQLPTSDQLGEFKIRLKDNRLLPDGFFEHMILPFPVVDIMNKLQTLTTELYSADSNHDDISVDNVVRQSLELIAKFPTMVAHSYQAMRYQRGHKRLLMHEPNGSDSIAENFLYMVRDDSQFTPLEAQLLDLMLVLHADHSGGNCSTFTNHVVTSSATDTYSAIGAALAALKGPRHGGANSSVMGMMDEIKGSLGRDNYTNESKVRDYLWKILNGEAGDGSGLVYGMGHAVYTMSDPRDLILNTKAQELAKQKGREDEFQLYEMIARLTPILMSELKKKEMVVSPNVDFHSGFIYDCLGIPRELYTPMFAISRVVGWLAHRIERVGSDSKIIRPASVYNGPVDVAYVPIAERC